VVIFESNLDFFDKNLDFLDNFWTFLTDWVKIHDLLGQTKKINNPLC